MLHCFRRNERRRANICLSTSCPDLVRASTSYDLAASKTWIAGSSPAMTWERHCDRIHHAHTPLRGRMTRISVNAPGCVSTSIAPACCLTTMSWLIDRPRPVPSPAGLVVKKGLNIFSRTSGGMPVPLSRMRISTRSPRLRVAATRAGSKPSPCLRLAFRRRVKAVKIRFSSTRVMSCGKTSASPAAGSSARSSVILKPCFSARAP